MLSERLFKRVTRYFVHDYTYSFDWYEAIKNNLGLVNNFESSDFLVKGMHAKFQLHCPKKSLKSHLNSA